MIYHHDAMENTYANYFKNTFSAGKAPFKWTDLTQEKDSNYFKIESHLSKDSNNIFVIPSFDEVFVNVITKQLAALSDNYKITVIGMPTWNEMESLRTDYLQEIHTYISSSYWVNDSSDEFIKFKRKYFNRFKSLPTGYTVEGYDLMYFIGYMLLQHDNKWADELVNTTGYELGDDYSIRPVENSDKQTLYMENRYVHILKYANNGLVKVN
jgi:ABC-type branched-subunit amino acid transport system substrate-binding protein